MAAGDEEVRRQFWRVARAFFSDDRPPNPAPSELPVARPDPARPVAADGDVRVTWIGHASTLVQLPALNLLTDPVWSERCSPLRVVGPRRFVPAPLALDELPPVHAVLLSHDHYDHLDRPTVVALHRRFGDGLAWLAPLGHADWLRSLGITRAVELDWWEGAPLPGGRFRAVAVPARHWTRRRPRQTNKRLWCGWVVVPDRDGTPRDGAPRGGGTRASGVEGGPAPRVWFAGDSGYCPAFTEIGERLGPFDVSLVPIGAYEPRWFMGSAHMNPEEAVQAYLDAGARGLFIPIHWGTFRLTFEAPLEPPVRVREAWRAAGLPALALRVLRHGETARVI
jgi:N-acyl-phosphatidylethanolamine-hydrolysing phospholipase D